MIDDRYTWVSSGDLPFVIDHLSFVIFKKFADIADLAVLDRSNGKLTGQAPGKFLKRQR